MCIYRLVVGALGVVVTFWKRITLPAQVWIVPSLISLPLFIPSLIWDRQQKPTMAACEQHGQDGTRQALARRVKEQGHGRVVPSTLYYIGGTQCVTLLYVVG